MLGHGPLASSPLGTSGSGLPLWFKAQFAGPPKEEAVYYESFGRFISAYAHAEAGVHIAARQHSGLVEEKARVLFGGMSLSSLSEKLRKLTEVTSHFDDVDQSLTQLDIIAKERDKLVHRLISYDAKEGFKVTDQLTVKSVGSADHRNFTLEELKAMEGDCYAIFYRLSLSSREAGVPKYLPPWISFLGMTAPWRYTPQSPKNRTRQPHANSRARKGQRR